MSSWLFTNNCLRCLSLNYFTLPYVTGSTLYALGQAINNTYRVTGSTIDSRYKCDRCNRNIRDRDNTNIWMRKISIEKEDLTGINTVINDVTRVITCMFISC